MEYFLSFLAGTGGVIFGALLVKLYMKWEDHKAEKDFQKWIDENFETLEAVEKPPVSDPPAPVNQPN